MRSALRHGLTAGLLAVAAFSLVACGEDEEDMGMGAPVDKSAVIKANTAPVAPVSAVSNPDFAYSPVGKRDPFRSYLADLKETEGETQRAPQPTENFELDQYRLTGLITGTSQPRAMVEDPQGTGHTLSIGTRLGKNGGRVTRISPAGVVIVEEYVNPVGKRVRVPITIKLPEDAEAAILRGNL